MRAALTLPDGFVVNVIALAADHTFEPPDPLALVELEDGSPVSPGWTYEDGDWVAPPPPPDPGPEPPSTQDQIDALILDHLTTTTSMQQQIDDLILAMLG